MAGAAAGSSGSGRSGAFSRGNDELLVGINVTPLVDVVLVLLVVLMVTASYVVSHTLPLDLPQARTGESTSGVLRISIDRQGTVYVDDRAVADAELRSLAQEASRADKNCRALIGADGDTRHQAVIRVVDALRAAGVSYFAINVKAMEHAAL